MMLASSARTARSFHALAIRANEVINDLRGQGKSDADILAIAQDRVTYYTERIDALENNTRFSTEYVAKKLEGVELGLATWAAVEKLVSPEPTHSDTCTDPRCTCHNDNHTEIVDSIRTEEEEETEDERKLREIKEEMEERIQKSREREWDRYGDDDL